MQIKKKYSHLFFDLDNTLWDFKKNSFFALKINCFNYKVHSEEDDFESFFSVYSRHNDLLWDAYRKKEISKNDLTQKRFQDTFNELGITGINPSDFNSGYLNEMVGQTYLIEGALDILKYLNTKYSLHIITNGFKEVQYKKLENTGLTPFFKKVFISEDVKSHKPESDIFLHAINSVNAKKNESLMIGDDWDVDILGARNFGIDQVFYSPGDINISNNPILTDRKHLTYFISHLCELNVIL